MLIAIAGVLELLAPFEILINDGIGLATHVPEEDVNNERGEQPGG